MELFWLGLPMSVISSQHNVTYEYFNNKIFLFFQIFLSAIESVSILDKLGSTATQDAPDKEVLWYTSNSTCESLMNLIFFRLAVIRLKDDANRRLMIGIFEPATVTPVVPVLIE